jgi:hypothetical protein
MYRKHIWFHMHKQTLGSCLKWGNDPIHLDSNLFSLNVKKLEAHMQKTHVFFHRWLFGINIILVVINIHISNFCRQSMIYIWKNNFIVSMMFGLTNLSFIALHLDGGNRTRITISKNSCMEKKSWTLLKVTYVLEFTWNIFDFRCVDKDWDHV